MTRVTRHAARTRWRPAAAALLGLALGACSGPPDAARAPASAASANGAPARAEHERGELLATACRACHTLARGDGHSIGPNLFGMFGRRAASLEDFEYSDALAESDIVWTAEQLDAWLAEPNDFLPGTTMTFSGYGSAADRRALIAYLREATTPQQ